MKSETLLHIAERLDESERRDLLTALGNPPNGEHADHQSSRPQLLFVAYDHDSVCPHDLIGFAADQGYHARLVDL